MPKRLKKGFTIVELVIVIAVIAILAAVLIPTFSGVIARANASAAMQEARSALANSLSMSSTASLPNGTLIVVKNGDAYYYFSYNATKMVQIDADAATGISDEAFDSVIVSDKATDTNNKLNEDIIAICKKVFNVTVTGSLVFEEHGKEYKIAYYKIEYVEEDTTKYEMKANYNSDFTPTCVVFVAKQGYKWDEGNLISPDASETPET